MIGTKDEKVVEVEGWKGKSGIEILGEYDEDILIEEHRKHKETKEVTVDRKVVKKERVKALWKLIKENCQLNEKYGYKFIVRKLVEHYGFHLEQDIDIDLFIDSFNGGSKRATFYFPYYYYPMKVLEARGLVQYLGHGGVIREKE